MNDSHVSFVFEDVSEGRISETPGFHIFSTGLEAGFTGRRMWRWMYAQLTSQKVYAYSVNANTGEGHLWI